jgi:glucose-6-phosphate isomerase
MTDSSTPDISLADRAWARLEAAAREGREARLAELVTPERVRRLTVKAAGLHVDLSKQAFTDEGLRRALELARDCDVKGRRAEMFAGVRINLTEDRAVEHWRCRDPDPGPGLAAERERLRGFVEAVRAGEVKTADGRRFRTLLHIGIGGSDLGPRLVWEALRSERPRLELRFAANVDPDAFANAVRCLDPRRTLVIAVSKTFGTLETLANLGHARAWLSNGIGEGADGHLAAVSANPERCARFGIPAERVFPMSDSVGGRFSVWSAVGLSCAIGLGWRVWSGFLAGAHAMDSHFRTAALARNAPVLMALAQVYNRNGLSRGARAVIPYAERLRLLPSWLQQLEMESNGKRVRLDGSPCPRATAPVVFGEPGTTSQHAFFQLLHQGTDIVPVDFVLAADRGVATVANGLAQAEALLMGQSDHEQPWKDFPGDRPSTTILLKAVDPRSTGSLLALYEHKTFVEGVLWGIDSFDQWGVELGKTLASRLMPELEGEAEPAGHDASTAALIERLRG